MKRFFSTVVLAVLSCHVFSQALVSTADRFIGLLDTAQRTKTLYPFGSEERYNFHYFPINDRKGLPLDEMTQAQKNAAFDLGSYGG